MHQKLSANPAHTIASILQRRSFFLAAASGHRGAFGCERPAVAALPTPFYQDKKGIREKK